MSFAVEVQPAADVVHLTVSGDLDEDAARTLLRTVAAAAASHAERLEIDLSALRSFTPEGVIAVTGCRRLGARMPTDVAFVVQGGVGAEALLASLNAAP